MQRPDLEKYSRQVQFAPLGRAGQERLAASRAIVVGCGALGSFTAQVLVRSGVGEVTVLDRDFVEASNLQRQSLYDENDAAHALPKAAAAESHLRKINSGVRVRGIITDVTPENVEELISGASVVLDGCDNFETRYLLNDTCVKASIPWIYAAALGSYGVTLPIVPGKTPCLACLFPDPPGGAVETCDTAGILQAAVTAAASFQVASAMKVLTGVAVEPLLISLDVWTGEVRTVKAGAPRADCQTCGLRQFRHLAGEGRPAITLCGRNSVQIHEHHRPLDLPALRTRLELLGRVRANEFALQFSPAPEIRMTLFQDGRAIVQGTSDPAVARGIYARYVGN